MTSSKNGTGILWLVLLIIVAMCPPIGALIVVLALLSS